MVKFKLKIQKGKKIIDTTVTMHQNSILYFLSRLAEYGWERV